MIINPDVYYEGHKTKHIHCRALVCHIMWYIPIELKKLNFILCSKWLKNCSRNAKIYISISLFILGYTETQENKTRTTTLNTFPYSVKFDEVNLVMN
jgi:hypothetical protein